MPTIGFATARATDAPAALMSGRTNRCRFLRFFLSVDVAVNNNGRAPSDHRQIFDVHEAVFQHRVAADGREVEARGVDVSGSQGSGSVFKDCSVSRDNSLAAGPGWILRISPLFRSNIQFSVEALGV